MVGMFLDMVRQFLDDPLMLWGVGVFVLGLRFGVLFFRAGFSEMVLGFEPDDSGFEVEEGAYGGDLLGVKAGEDGVVGDGAEGGDPLVDGGDLTGFHQHKGAEHVLWGDGRSSSRQVVVGSHQGPERRQIERFHHRADSLVMKGNHLDFSEVALYEFHILPMRT